MDISTLFGILVAFVLIAVNGYFVATEFAMLRVRPTRIDQLAASGEKNASMAREQLRRLDLSLAAAQIGITLAGLVLGWIGEPALEHALEPLFTWASGPVAHDIATGLAIIISLMCITSLHMIFGEVLPKSIGITHSEKMLLFAARPFSLFTRVFYPLIRALHWVERALMQALRLHSPVEGTLLHSPEEFDALAVRKARIDILGEEGEDASRRVLAPSDKTAAQEMTPALSVSTTIPLGELLTHMQNKHMYRASVINASGEAIGIVTLENMLEDSEAIETISVPEPTATAL